jgi:hypothetical protein
MKAYKAAFSTADTLIGLYLRSCDTAEVLRGDLTLQTGRCSVPIMPCLLILKESPILLFAQPCAVGQNISICSATESLNDTCKETACCER